MKGLFPCCLFFAGIMALAWVLGPSDNYEGLLVAVLFGAALPVVPVAAVWLAVGLVRGIVKPIAALSAAPDRFRRWRIRRRIMSDQRKAELEREVRAEMKGGGTIPPI